MSTDDHDDERKLETFMIPSKCLEGLTDGPAIGSGAYGVAFELSLNGMPCIGKRLHAILASPMSGNCPEGRKAVCEKFRRECVLLSRLRSPYIVQFLGVHGAGENLTLVMERMHMDLATALEQFPDIPIPHKVRILLDVSCGLMHLHSWDPPIVHRDLTAANILVSPEMRAKVADLGLSKILDASPHELSRMTQCPGAVTYMPLEALQQHPEYGTELDVFSFGHLALYVANQQFPEVHDLEQKQYRTVKKGRLSVARRQVAMNLMGKKHCLYKIVKRCLRDCPAERPSAPKLRSDLQSLSTCNPYHPMRYIEDYRTQRTSLQQAEDRVVELESENASLRQEMGRVRDQVVDLQQRQTRRRSSARSSRSNSDSALPELPPSIVPATDTSVLVPARVYHQMKADLDQAIQQKNDLQQHYTIIRHAYGNLLQSASVDQEAPSTVGDAGAQAFPTGMHCDIKPLETPATDPQECQHLYQDLQRFNDRIMELEAHLEKKTEQIEEHAVLQRKIHSLKEELELERIQVHTFRMDFESERRDRERAHSMLSEMNVKIDKKVSQLKKENDALTKRQELMVRDIQEKDDRIAALDKIVRTTRQQRTQAQMGDDYLTQVITLTEQLSAKDYEVQEQRHKIAELISELDLGHHESPGHLDDESSQ